jgi:hypothetical protein
VSTIGALARIILVHGTWGRGFDPDKDAGRMVAGEPVVARWFEAGSKFCKSLSSGLAGAGQATDLSAFLWSGANSIEERNSAATGLAKKLDECVVAAPDTPHFIIAHSHGGNVALDARQRMSASSEHVHVVTLATPFLSIQRKRTPLITDKLFAICVSIGLVVFESYLWMPWALHAFAEEDSPSVFLYANYFISLLFVLLGSVTLFCGAKRRNRKNRLFFRLRSKTLEATKRFINQSLLAIGVLFCALSLLLLFNEVAALWGVVLLPLLLPFSLVLSFSISAARKFLYGAKRRNRKNRLFGALRSKTLESTERFVDQSLLAIGVLFCASLLLSRSDDAADLWGFSLRLLPLLLPFSLMLFFSISTVTKFLYGAPNTGPRIGPNIPNLRILRSPWDEASLALLFGRFASILARIASLISIIAPIVAAILIALVLCFLLYLSLKQLWGCFDIGTCNPGAENVLFLDLAVLNKADKIVRYVAFGLFISTTLVFLAAACKSLFGRELLYGSLNAIVDVHDTPDGSNSHRIDWCAQFKESWFGLSHSLYNNPDAVKKIIAHISDVSSTGADRPASVAGTHKQPWKRNRLWQGAAALAVAAGSYTIAAMLVYAPPGATSSWCALRTYFEAAGPAGGFTVLVARFENDVDDVGERLAEEIRQRYGFHVIRTCSQVTTSADDSSSAKNLLFGYHSNLILWGNAAKEGRVELQIAQRGYKLEEKMPIILTSVSISDFVAKQMQKYLIKAIVDSPYGISSEPPANIAAYADQVEAFTQSVDWSVDPSEDALAIDRVWDQMEMNATVGRLMLAAARGSGDGSRAKKAVAYFQYASSLLDKADKEVEFKGVLKNNWSSDYRVALLSDGQLNKNEESGKLAASMYLKEYEDDRKIGLSSRQLYQDAGLAAFAVSELYSITKDQDTANSTLRLACESLVWLRHWQKDNIESEKWLADLAQKGKYPGTLGESPNPEKGEPYKILVRFGKDPSAIFAPGRKMNVEDCNTF